MKGERILDIKEIALKAARAAADKKALDIKVLDMRAVTLMADYFVICSADSMPHLRAITRGILDEFKDVPLKVNRREGSDDSRWVLIDFGDVVIHVFHHAEREFYDLETLWGDATEVDWETTTAMGQTLSGW